MDDQLSQLLSHPLMKILLQQALQPSPRMEQAMPPTADLPSANDINSLGLTPQEEFLYQHHVGNLQSGKAVHNEDGSVSTIYSINTEGPGGLTYNLPTVWDGKIVPAQEAIQRAAEVGWNRWPAYATSDEADARYEQMHRFMARDVEKR